MTDGPGAVGVEIRDLRCGYGRLRRRAVLDGLDLLAAPGRITAVVGANGVGKTTLFRVVLGFLAPWSGSVRVHGVAPRAHRRREGVGYLPESVALPAGFTLRDFLLEGARLSGLDRASARRAADAELERSGLGALHGRALHTFSKGMARRAALAFVLLGDPRLVLLDEPMSGLDPRSRAALREQVAALPERGGTVLLASHDLVEVQRVADSVTIVDGGQSVRLLEGEELRTADLERLVVETDAGGVGTDADDAGT